MINFFKKTIFSGPIFGLLLSFSSIIYAAAPLVIANVPLGTSTGNSVKPNLLLVLDDSGSMASDYTPDSVNDKVCQTNMASLGSIRNCNFGEVTYNSSVVNSQYYNPAIRYYPPKNSDNSDWANASTSATLSDPFLDKTTTVSLTTKYQDTYWCSGNSYSSSTCKNNTTFPAIGYSYPNGTYKNAVNRDGNPYYYTMSSSPSWCSDAALTKCQSKRTSTFKYPSVFATSAVTGVASSTSFRVQKSGTSTSGSGTVTITFDGNVIATITSITYTDSYKNRNSLASDIATAITNTGKLVATVTASEANNSSCSASNTSGCAVITVTNTSSPASVTNNTSYNGKSLAISGSTNFVFSSPANFTGGVDYSAATSGIVVGRVDIVSTTTTYPKGSNRTDCTSQAGSCSYAEELQNFANWYSFYRTRIQMMKTAISRSFGGITDTAPGVGFRVGLTYISSGASSSAISNAGDTTCWTANKAKRLAIGDFNATNKASFYTDLFGVVTCTYTPLRAALALAGKVYAGTGYIISSSDPDPVQFSCQQNFTFMSTDGYWNSNIEDSTTYGPFTMSGSTTVGDQDGSDSGAFKDALALPNTLADVAAYYYKNDLRPNMTNDVPTSASDSNSAQHMVTFTMGLGVSGNLIYSPTYQTDGSGDYRAITQGTKNWGDPINNTTDARIDDLWHAAVNGHGKYFSAADPSEVSSSLDEALVTITAQTGSGAAAATSNLEPIAGDNFAYIASYNPDTWYGNLEARTIDISTGAISDTATPIWAEKDLLGTQSSRTLYGFKSSISGADKKINLTWSNAQGLGWDSTTPKYFDYTRLSQCTTASNCPVSTGKGNEYLFTFLTTGVDNTTNKSFRARKFLLGDIVNSQPVYVKQPTFGYSDGGYGTFKATTRDGMVYVGANDGFLHAFNASTGSEEWAYLPTAVVPNLYKLADNTYSHNFYVDGSITVGDVDIGVGTKTSSWKTLLIGGLNNGGSSFYAIDVTRDTSSSSTTTPYPPKMLWEFTDSEMGQSFGNPIITKLPTGSTDASGNNIEGKWVVLLTSGYNNTKNGYGVLYVLDAYTGIEQFRIYTCTSQSSRSATTCSGTSSSPVGLAKINAWVDDPVGNNTALYVYGGDLDGNMWRFDLAAKKAFAMAKVGEPITTKPELALVQGNKVVYFGTGQFLEGDDRAGAEGTATRTIYGIKDDLTATTGLTNVKAAGGPLVQQTIALVSGSSTQRTVPTPAAVNWSAKSGWYVNLLETGERVNVDPKIQLGTLVVASNVPDSSTVQSCTAGGHGWINYLDITTGSYVSNSQSNSSQIFGSRIGNALVVGINVIKLSNGKIVAITTTTDNKHSATEAPVSSASLPMKRVSWRELLTD